MMLQRRLGLFGISISWLALDLATKHYVQEWLAKVTVVNWFEGFRFILVYNQGAAFGFLGSAGGWQRFFFIALAILVTLYLAWRLWLAHPGEQRFNIGLSFILGGAIGNMIDRINHGHVVDFIDVYVGRWHWPAFNVADIAIVLGAAIVIADSFGIGRSSGKAK